MTKTFTEVIAGIRTAKKGVEVREDLAQMGEYCQQFTEEAGKKADAARDEAKGYATNAKESERKATQTVQGIEQTKADAVQAVQQAQSTAVTAVQEKQTAAEQAVDTTQTSALEAISTARSGALEDVAASTKAAADAAAEAGAAKTAAAGSASVAASAAGSASASAGAAATSESNAAASADNANADAERSEAAAKKAEAVVGTDKTFTIKGAPADAAAVGEALGKKADASQVQDEKGEVLFYSKKEVDDALNTQKQEAAKTYLPMANGKMTGPLILADGYNAYGIASNAAAHNAMPPRFKNLGTAATSDIHAAIKAGTFDDIFVGDYFMVGDNPIYIGALDWYLNCGDTSCSEHHALLVPGNNLYAFHMNGTNTTEGGYVGSDMYKNGLTRAKQFFSDAFGVAHILSHRKYLVNAVTSGKPTGTDWYDSTVELMNENMVYGVRQFSPMPDGSGDPWNTCRNYTIDKSQLPLFQYAPWLICNRNLYWLRDVVSTAGFARVGDVGNSDCGRASYAHGVRPVAGLIG